MSNLPKFNGQVIESLPSLQFIVKLEDGRQVRAYLSGKMIINKIKVLIGDGVVIEMPPMKNTMGRIILRK